MASGLIPITLLSKHFYLNGRHHEIGLCWPLPTSRRILNTTRLEAMIGGSGAGLFLIAAKLCNFFTQLTGTLFITAG